VIGSTNSSNSNRLRELAEKQNVSAYLIDGADDIDDGWFDHAKAIGITAGASAPEILVQQVIAKLEKLFNTKVIASEKVVENVHFQLPRELREYQAEA
jgi:4-hydroxy-3-methylbut-2-enyl diphosphate reductase